MESTYYTDKVRELELRLKEAEMVRDMALSYIRYALHDEAGLKQHINLVGMPSDYFNRCDKSAEKYGTAKVADYAENVLQWIYNAMDMFSRQQVINEIYNRGGMDKVKEAGYEVVVLPVLHATAD